MIEVTDNDAVFDEIDGSQVLTNSVNLDGTNYATNTSIHSAYDLINTTTGHKITSLHFGGNGYQQGAIDGIASTIPPIPGATYTFDSERTSYQRDNQYTDYFVSVASDPQITTLR